MRKLALCLGDLDASAGAAASDAPAAARVRALRSEQPQENLDAHRVGVGGLGGFSLAGGWYPWRSSSRTPI
jgi:hypothetical protein